jgi:sugar phosphate isomerase/epimerase
MKLGLMSDALPQMTLDQLATWASENGFEMLEIACWPAGGGDTRRYAGTSHIDVADLSDTQATEIVDEIAAKGLSISGLGYYPNPLNADPAHREQVIGPIDSYLFLDQRENSSPPILLGCFSF